MPNRPLTAEATARRRAALLQQRLEMSRLDTPEEQSIAQAMLDATPGGGLVRIAADIKAEWGKGIESQWEVGRLLVKAAKEFPPQSRGQDESGRTKGSPFGEWFRAQEFPFTIVTAWRLRTAAEREDEVRAFIADASHSTSTSRRGYRVTADIGPATAIEYMNRKPSTAKVEKAIEHEAGTGTTTAFDAFRAAAAALVFSVLPADEMVEFATIVTALVAEYQAEKNRRAAS